METNEENKNPFTEEEIDLIIRSVESTKSGISQLTGVEISETHPMYKALCQMQEMLQKANKDDSELRKQKEHFVDSVGESIKSLVNKHEEILNKLKTLKTEENHENNENSEFNNSILGNIDVPDGDSKQDIGRGDKSS